MEKGIIGFLEPFTDQDGNPVSWAMRPLPDDDGIIEGMMAYSRACEEFQQKYFPPEPGLPAHADLDRLAVAWSVAISLPDDDEPAHLICQDGEWRLSCLDGKELALDVLQAGDIAASTPGAAVRIFPGPEIIAVRCGNGTFNRLCDRNGFQCEPAIRDAAGALVFLFRRPNGMMPSRRRICAGCEIIWTDRAVPADARSHESGISFSPEARLGMDIGTPAECPDWLSYIISTPQPKKAFTRDGSGTSELEDLNGLNTDISHILSSYASLGLKAIPLDPESLLPLTQGPDWGATNDPDEARALEEAYPGCVAGLLTGRGLIGIQCPDAGSRDAFRQWCGERGTDADETSRITSGKRVTYIFSLDPGAKTELPGDVRIFRDGEYVIAGPARDSAGNIYELHDCGLLDFPVDEGKAGTIPEVAKAEVDLNAALKPGDQSPFASEPGFLPALGINFPQPSPLELDLAYAKAGIPIFPVLMEDGVKKPKTSKAFNGKRWGQATDEGIVAERRARWPGAMTGGAMGEASGMFVVDCDVKDGVDGIASFNTLCSGYGYDPSGTFMVETPSGGRHYYFRYPPGSCLSISAGHLGRNIDTRGEGGYVVLPGSTRGDGKAYIPLNALPLADLPEFIIDLLREGGVDAPCLDAPALPACDAEMAKALERGLKAIRESVEGERNATLNNVAYYIGLHARGRQENADELMDALADAALGRGLGWKEASATVRSGFMSGLASKDPIIKGRMGKVPVSEEISDVIPEIGPIPDEWGAFSESPTKGRQGRTSVQAGALRSACRLHAAPDDWGDIPDFDAGKRGAGKRRKARKPYEPGLLFGWAAPDGMLPDLEEISRKSFPENIHMHLLKLREEESMPLSVSIPFLLMLISACIGGTRVLRIRGSRTTGANLYMLGVGGKGSGKSTAMEYFLNPIVKMEAEFDDQYAEELEQYRKDLEEWQKRQLSRKKDERGNDDPKPEKPIRKELITDDATIEAALATLAANPRGMLWMVDEAGDFVARTEQYAKKDSGSNLAVKLIRAWSGAEIKVSRKSHEGEARDFKIGHAFFTIICVLQPKLLKGFFTEKDMDRGFASRWLFFHLPEKPEGTAGAPPPWGNGGIRPENSLLDVVARRLLETLGVKEVRMHHEPIEIELGERLYEYSRPSIAKMSKAMDYGGELRGWVIRLCDMIHRFAMILHYLRWAADEDALRKSPDQGLEEADYDGAFELMRIFAINLDRTLWMMQAPERERLDPMTPVERSILNFVMENWEWCQEYRTAREIYEKGFDGAKNAISFGITLTNLGFPSAGGGRVAKSYRIGTLEPWEDRPELKRMVIEKNNPESKCARIILESKSEIEACEMTLGLDDFRERARLKGSAGSEHFLSILDRLDIRIEGERLIVSPLTFEYCKSILED